MTTPDMGEMDPSLIEQSALAAQWLGAWATVAGAVVAAAFGYLTWSVARKAQKAQMTASAAQERARYAQDTASYAAAQELAHIDGQGVMPAGPPPVTWRVDSASGGERWLLINDGTGDAFDVSMRGLTDIDQQRLQAAERAAALPSADAVGFTFVSRLSLSGPGNIVVSWRTGPNGMQQSKVLRVPAP